MLRTSVYIALCIATVTAGCFDSDSAESVEVVVLAGQPGPNLSLIIDGIETTEMTATFPSEEAALEHEFVIETFDRDGQIVDRMAVGAAQCTYCRLQAPLHAVTLHLCTSKSGALAFGSATCTTNSGQCIADGFCIEPE